MKLKYGMNPNQSYAEVIDKAGALTLIHGTPSVINILDALNSWQLVKEVNQELQIETAASFKHVTPSGVAISKKITEQEKNVYQITTPISPLSSAYSRARGADRLASFGDFIALSHDVDTETAQLLKTEVTDGIIAPGFSPEALEILKTKKNGNFVIFAIDKNYEPEEIESRDVFGIKIKQQRNNQKISNELLSNIVTKKNEIATNVISDIKLGMITLKYTQSNSICIVYNGQVIGIGSGQQSRILCSKLAATKANIWYQKLKLDYSFLKDHTGLKKAAKDQIIEQNRQTIYNQNNCLKELSNTCLISDGFFPQIDNIELANEYGIKYIASPMGSIKDKEIIETADKYGITFINTGLRLFHH